jgi:hypothetical protein
LTQGGQAENQTRKCPTDESGQRILIRSSVGGFYPLEKFLLFGAN